MSDPNSPADWDRYYIALGKFIDTFSGTEQAALFLLMAVARLDYHTARALFTGVKVQVAIGNVRRVFRARNLDLPPLLDKSLAQLTVITNLRNDITHDGAYVDPDGQFFSSDILWAMPDSHKNIQVSPEILDSATADLQLIDRNFSVWLTSVTSHNSQDQDFQTVFENLIREGERAPWRYKPPAQQPARKKPRASGPKR